MELTLEQALQKGVEAHKAGKVQEADRYYTAILKANPKHPDSNHIMGVLAVGVGKIEAALPFFKTALEANSSIAQYWLTYIDALIKLDRMEDARTLFEQAKSKSAKDSNFDHLEKSLKKLPPKNSKAHEPSQEEIKSLINLYTQGKYREALNNASRMLVESPNSFRLYNITGAANQGLGKQIEAVEAYKKAISLRPNYAKAYNNMGSALKEQQKLDEAIEAYNKAISIKPDYAEAYYNLGNALQEQSKPMEAIEAYTKAVSIRPDYAEAYYNMGNTFREKGMLNRAIETYTKAISIKPNDPEPYNNMGNALRSQAKISEAMEAYNKAISINPAYANVYWNLSGTAENISEAKRWIEQCLRADPDHLMAKLILSALKFYEGDKGDYNKLIKSSLKDHPYTRSFSWTFNLPDLPPLYFHRWALFDKMMNLSKKNRPFYEFGVWRGEAFRYLIKTLKKGYGFDTFEGLPEDWHNKKAGTYTSDGNIHIITCVIFILC